MVEFQPSKLAAWVRFPSPAPNEEGRTVLCDLFCRNFLSGGEVLLKTLIIRHGETDWNRAHKLQGTKDIPLNEVGLAQAETAYEALKDKEIDVAFCSPLIRTKQTAEVILRGRDVPIIYDERIVERRFGVAEGTSISDIDFENSWLPGRQPIYDGMETFEQLYDRIADFFDDVYKKYPDKTVLVITHGGVSIVCGYYFLGPPKTDRREYFCKNCVVKEYVKE